MVVFPRASWAESFVISISYLKHLVHPKNTTSGSMPRHTCRLQQHIRRFHHRHRAQAPTIAHEAVKAIVD
jgi:hypothetical protein